MISFRYRSALLTAERLRGRLMQAMANTNQRGAHEERERATWNGFLTLAIGIAMIALAIWELVHTITVGRPSSVAGLIGAILLFIVLMIAGVLCLAALFTVQ